MGDENKALETMNVTLTESELKDFALSKPEETDQPADDKKSDEDTKAAEAAAAKVAEETEARKAAEAEVKKKEGEGEKGEEDQDAEAKAKAEAETKAKAEAEEEDEDDPVLVEFEGQKYTQSEFKNLIKGNMQAADYTQKTQELGGLRASIEPLIKLLDNFKGDPKGLIKDFRDALVEEEGEDAGKLLDAAINFDPEKSPHPDVQKAKDLQEKVDKFEAEKAFVDAQTAFVSDMKAKGIKISKSEAEKVGQFTLEYFQKTNAALSLEDAYKLMKADGWRTQAEEATKKTAEDEKKKAHDAIPSKEKGASDFSKVQDQLTPASDMKVTLEEMKEAGVSTFFNV